jgi:hypothetical protein
MDLYCVNIWLHAGNWTVRESITVWHASADQSQPGTGRHLIGRLRTQPWFVDIKLNKISHIASLASSNSKIFATVHYGTISHTLLVFGEVGEHADPWASGSLSVQ